ncbi:MAG: efflux RND transporter periplasmic adaptor subunit [Candidatus Eisenbacteria sp.]|nr:efflux RND transporter periplasmic adaptor subunit [Candidatus Eisenbacteria bacterium]
MDRSRMRKRAIILVGALVLVVVLIVVVNQRVGGPGSVKVYASEVAQQTIRATVSGPGHVVPEKQVDMSSGVMGRIVHLAVREGDQVNEGDLLLQIDSTQYAARVRQAESSLRAARSSVTLQQSRLERLEMELKRRRELRSNRLVSEKEIEAAETDVKVGRAEVNSAGHRVEEMEARLASMNDDLLKTTMTAPISGIVSSLKIEEGEIAIVGTMNYPGTVLMTLSDLSLMEVEAEIDETDILDVAVGQDATVHVDALGDSTLKGTVIEIASSAHRVGVGTMEEVTNFRVRVRIDGERVPLKPGMSANVDIETAVRSDVVSVPIQSVVKRKWSSEGDSGDSGEDADESSSNKEEKPGVFAVEDDKAVFRVIKTGISDETDIEVLSGLEKGQTVITGPYKILARLKDGDRVSIEEDEEPDRAD